MASDTAGNPGSKGAPGACSSPISSARPGNFSAGRHSAVLSAFFPLLCRSPLFAGIGPEELPALLSCLGAGKRCYRKHELILRSGETTSSICFVLEGAVHIVKEDFWGTRSLIAKAGQGDFFGETYACCPQTPLGVAAEAAEDCALLFLNAGRILTSCSSACPFHQRLIRNLLAALAQKNLMLTKKMEHLSKRSIREKLLSYLSDVSIQAESPEFTIPFNRQQLADYLYVDRSALSAELSKLKKEGLLDYRKNWFWLAEGGEWDKQS